ncbi:MAG: hypothetical protein GF393_09955 [Armatimonadia bacterium]|nr:hypothetical protein [Armatimonadia bacterium]
MTSAGQTLLESILPQVLDVALPMLAVAAVALWMVGRASLRMLQETYEEISHREEMEWGARYYWAVLTGSIAIPIAAMLTALTSTTYPVTVAVLGALSIGPIGFVLHMALPYQLHGGLLWLTSRRRQEGETTAELIARQRGQECSRRARWLQGGIAALYVGMMVWAGMTTVPLDESLMQYERADQLAAQIVEGIGPSEVVKAHVIFDGMLDRAPGNRVLLRAEDGASQETVNALLDAAASDVRDLLPPGEWTVKAWADGGGEAERVVIIGEGTLAPDK